MNSAFSEFQDLFRNPRDLLRQTRGSDVLYISCRIMINKEMLNISSKITQHRNFSPIDPVASNVHTCRRKNVRGREEAPKAGSPSDFFFFFFNGDIG